MSRRRGVEQSRFLLFSSALFLLLSLQRTSADGNIGCLYSSQQCDPKTEWCFDDNAFGRCMFKFGFAQDDLYRYQFKYDDLEKLKEELEQLRELGYSWQHSYTQCIVQNQLNSIKFGLPYNGEICEQVLKKEPTDPVRALQYEQGLALHNQKNHEFLRSSNEGIIKFEPDDGDDTRRFANRNDYLDNQPDYENELINQLRMQSNIKPEVYKKNMKSTSSRYRGTPLYVPIHNRDKFKTDENDLSASEEIFDENADMNWDIRPNEKQEVYDNIFNLQKALNVINREKAKAYAEGGSMYISDKKNEYEDSVYDKIFDQYGSDIFGFQRSERLDVKKPGPYFKVNNYAFGNMNNVQNQEHENKEEYEDDSVSKIKVSHRNVERSSKELNPEYEYVPNYGLSHGHGPISYPLRSDNSSYVTIETNNWLTQPMVSQFIGSLTKLHYVPPGVFKSSKVEKNRITLFVGPNILNFSAADVKRLIEADVKENMIHGIDIKHVYIGQPSEDLSSRANVDSDKYPVVNTDYAYIQLKNKIKNWPEVDVIIGEIARLLNLPRNSFRDIKSGVSDIAFKIGPNTQNLTASEVAKKIELIKDKIEDKFHIDITSVGNGDKVKFPLAVPLEERDTRLYLLTFIVCGVIGAVLVSSIALYFIKKQARLKDKLLIPREKELGKDYQELCRNRMTGKSAQESSAGGQRITSLSRESDNSPSSRSSTSSWSEEPMTNMDITTGHMVLAYMEDHLTNKARLDTEWAALCAYDADPCSVSVAQLAENIRKNRYVNALPYDHARVFLNALSNVNGSDYINASTITDHDPRNPAYIASQGPLENTVCDFWQMIWEQGCVVIVMLTRLVENDTSMCQRYWPLEGAELYNIYEVHLVSEHIWCDDFLVRSFYLKNLKTTETRTVTQFHFLTWPEGGIPSATKPLLEFRRKVNKSFRGRSCPIVVHCSDGVGRTGSYLLLDMVLNRISKGAKEIDIAATLEHIRDQRAGAVCTKQQFQFVLSAVAEEVQAVLRALPQQQPTTQEQASENGLPVTGQPQASGGQNESVATTSAATASTNSSQVQGQVAGGQPPRKQSK